MDIDVMIAIFAGGIIGFIFGNLFFAYLLTRKGGDHDEK